MSVYSFCKCIINSYENDIAIFSAAFKKMRDQKIREHIKAYENQQKQLAALKKGGKSSKQATEEMKSRMQNKQNKGPKGKRSSATIGDDGWLSI